MKEQEKKAYQRKRDIFLRFMVDEKERDLIYKKMEQSGIKSLRAYMLKMAVDGRVIHVELDSVKEMIRLLSNATNNINQISKRVHETGHIYAADVNDLTVRCQEIWTQAKEILRRLSDL